MNTKKMTINNKNAKRQADLEQMEDSKAQLLAEAEESTSKMQQKITEHGQILMTINNLFKICYAKKEMLSLSKYFTEMVEPKDFDNMQERGKYALG